MTTTSFNDSPPPVYTTLPPLIARLLPRLVASPTPRTVIAIAGIPGSGKSTLATTLCDALNTAAGSEVAVVVGMDGLHYSRAHRRRGAPFTFDAKAFIALTHRLPTTPHLHAPTFDHALKDPVPNGVEILPSHRVVLLEGLYTHLSIPPWDGVVADERWFVRCEEEVAAQRLVERHLRTGVEGVREEAVRRVRSSDLVNGRVVVENRVRCDLEVDLGGGENNF
ncbi:hypothetical protein HDU96_005891 [Phlyctochytrium bullatum]|nr:hypothetical protein HDU96_005891 [Phlyctochytrium bullatum]